MKYFSLLCFVLLFGITNYAQQIANVEFEQIDNKIIIYYDLETYNNARYYVNIYCSKNDGKNWGQPLKSVAGNVGNDQIPGTGKSITWDVLKDRKKLTADVEFKIEATPVSDPFESRNNIKYNTFTNSNYHFTIKYPDVLIEMPVDMLQDINNLPHNQQMDISFDAGFIDKGKTFPPLITVYILRKNHPSDFYKIADKMASQELKLSKTVDAFNDIIPIIDNASIEKPIIDFENKIIISTAEMDFDLLGYSSHVKGMFVQFYGKDKIIQLNCISATDEFISDLQDIFLPIVKTFAFDPGYKFVSSDVTIDKDSPFNIPGKEFMSGYTSKYICDGSGKGRGLKFSIKYPQSWKSEEGNRPHIVRKFYNDDMSAQVMIWVDDLEFIPSKSEVDDFFTTENAKNMIPADGRYIKSNTTVIEGEKSLVIDYTVKRERLGTIFTSKYRMYSIFYKSYLLQVLFNVSQAPHEEPKDLIEEFEKYEMLFNAMINSFSLISKWEDY